MDRSHRLGLIAALVILASVGGLALRANTFDSATADERVQDSASIRTSAESFASKYLQETLGNISLEDLAIVDIRYEPAVTELMTSITTGFYSTDPQDVWVVAWERDGVANVATGQNDGTVALVLVLRNGTGEVLSAAVGIRQPGEQALARGPLPEFRDSFGPPPVAR